MSGLPYLLAEAKVSVVVIIGFHQLVCKPLPENGGIIR